MPEPWTAERARSFFDYEAQPKELSRVCDLCGSNLHVAPGPADRDRYGFPVKHEECAGCGLVFQYPRLSPAGLRALYSGPYRALVSAWHGREINAQTLEPEQSMYGARLAAILEAAAMPTGNRLLDLGGSTGVVAARVAWALQDPAKTFPNGRHVTVVEPSASEAAAAVRRANRVVVQSAEDFEPGGERWDLILLCQTVDHLRSISAVLRKVRTWLAPGGRFFVDAVDSSLIPEAERYKIDHVYALTAATMERYLETCGFKWQRVPAPSSVNHVAYLCEVA